MKKFSHIIWDYNGTLLDDVWLCVDEINKMLKKRHLPTLTERSYRNVFGFPVEHYYRKIGFDFQKEPFSILGTEFIINYDKRRDEPHLHDYAVETLRLIEEKEISQSVISARDKDSLHYELKKNNITCFFENIVGHHNHYADGKLLQTQYFFKKHNLKPSEVLLIGDTSHDADVALELDCHCILLSHGHNTTNRLESTGFPVFDNFPALYKYLDEIL